MDGRHTTEFGEGKANTNHTLFRRRLKYCRRILFQDQRKGWSDRMRQYLGICIPSGCTWDDIYNNYEEVYDDIHSRLDRKSSVGCFTDEFLEDYYSAAREDTSDSRGQKVFL